MNIEREQIMERIVGGRIRLTAMRCGDIGVRISRFERRVLQIHPPGDRDPEGVFVIRLEKPAPAEYDLKRRGRIYFDTTLQKWYALTKDDQEIIFLPELVGVQFLVHRNTMENCGFVIAGEDVRRILFRALYDNHKDMLREPLMLIQAVDKKGDALCAYVKELQEKHTDWFTQEEHTLIHEYLGTR